MKKVAVYCLFLQVLSFASLERLKRRDPRKLQQADASALAADLRGVLATSNGPFDKLVERGLVGMLQWAAFWAWVDLTPQW